MDEFETEVKCNDATRFLNQSTTRSYKLIYKLIHGDLLYKNTIKVRIFYIEIIIVLYFGNYY